VVIGERALREVYLPQFEALVKGAHVGAVMSAYNQVNGTYASENAPLLHDVLKTEWGFSGLVMSDWFLGVHSGAGVRLDIEMPPPASTISWRRRPLRPSRPCSMPCAASCAPSRLRLDAPRRSMRR
jgi:hypothetical protein